MAFVKSDLEDFLMLALKSDWHHSKHKETDVLSCVKQFKQKYVLNKSEIMAFASLINYKNHLTQHTYLR